MTGLLKCVAIELKLTATNNQSTQFGNMCKILLGVVQDSERTDIDSHYYSMLLTNNTSMGNHTIDDFTNKNGVDHPTTAGLLICKLLECLDFDVKQCDRPKFEYFDDSLMHQLLTVIFINIFLNFFF